MNKYIKQLLTTVLLAATILWVIPAQAEQITPEQNDSINKAIKESRGLKQYTFVPKGQWIVGGNISYSQRSSDNYQFLVIEGINGGGYSFNVSPMFCYMFANNMGVGGRFSYDRSLIKLNSAGVTLSDDMNFNIGEIYSLSHSYSGMAVLRNYISIGRNTRFGIFNETQLQIGGGQSKLVSGTGESITGSYESKFSLGINLAPGIVAFINDNIAVELNIGILGFNYTKTTQLTDQVYTGSTNSTSASFQINLFSIGLGVAFYI